MYVGFDAVTVTGPCVLFPSEYISTFMYIETTMRMWVLILGQSQDQNHKMYVGFDPVPVSTKCMCVLILLQLM